VTLDENAEKRRKNKEKQRRYRENLKKDAARSRVTFVVKNETLDRIREIAGSDSISQGEVIDRLILLKGGSVMENAEVRKAEEEAQGKLGKVDMEDYLLRETARDIMATMIGFNIRDEVEEENKNCPDVEKIKELEKEGKRLSLEQRKIIFGDKELMRYVINNYGPIIRARYAKKWAGR